MTDQLGGQLTVSANWFIYGPLKLGQGSACTNSANPPQCSTAGWTYSGFGAFGPPKPVILGYGQYCPSLTFSAGGIPCSSPAYVGYEFVELIDTATCAASAPSNAASLLVNISSNC